MQYAELIEKLQALPVEKQAEVFDFVEFLAVRCSAAKSELPVHHEWTETVFSAFSMSHAMRELEEEPALYTRDDLKEHWQYGKTC